MVRVDKKIEILKKNKLIPLDLISSEIYKIVNIEAVNFDFSNYKYSESDETFQNTIISIEIKNTNINKSFFINIFEGTTYWDTNVQNVTLSETPVIINGEENVEYIESDDDNIESFDEVLFSFKDTLFIGNLQEDKKAVLKDNFGVLELVASSIVNVDFLIIDEKISSNNPDWKILLKIYSDMKEVAKNKLYKVTVIKNNQLLCFIPFLTKKEAEETFIRCCVEYVTNCPVLKKEEMDLSKWQEYILSKKDDSLIAISFM